MRRFLMILAAGASLMGCTLMESPVTLPGEEGAISQVTFSIADGAPVKGSPYTGEFSFEKEVHSVSYFVFDSNGNIEAQETIWSAESSRMNVSLGKKTVYALVNIDPLLFQGVSTLSEFEAAPVTFDDMTRGSFPMSGKVSLTLSGSSGSVVVPVLRYVSRIYVATVSNSLEDNLEGEDIDIRNIYVTNVVGGCRVDGESLASPTWYNRFGRADWADSKDDYISEQSDSYLGNLAVSEQNYTICSDDYYDPGVALYFFPNEATSDSNGWASAFSGRYTRVVVEAYIRGELYFYPVSIVSPKRNHSYTLYLDITRPGSKDPDTFVWAQIQDLSVDIGGFDEFEDDFTITY